MSSHDMMRPAVLRLAIALILCSGAVSAQGVAELRGQIYDESGKSVAGAAVSLIDQDGNEQNTRTDEHGFYRFLDLKSGKYCLRAAHQGVATSELASLNLVKGQIEIVDLKLTASMRGPKGLASGKSSDNLLDEASDANRSGFSAKRDGQSVSQSQEKVSAESLKQLTGPASGPAGTEIDFKAITSATAILQEKRAIREVVINRNAFSAENDGLANSQTSQIPTPGTGTIHGEAILNFTDNAINTRHPSANVKAPAHQRVYAGNLSGPLLSNKASYFVSANRRALDEYAVIDATVLNEALDVVYLKQVSPKPEYFLSLNSSVDLLVNKANVLRMGFVYDQSDYPNSGIGGKSLPTRALNQDVTSQLLKVTVNSIISSRAVSETQFQYYHWRKLAFSDPQINPIVVPDSFGTGSADVRKSIFDQDFFELSNYITFTPGRHSLKFGGRFRVFRVSDFNDLKGTWVFDGRMAPVLDRENRIIQEAGGQPQLTYITGIEVYRRTLLFQRRGLKPSDIRPLGGGSTRLITVDGNPLAIVRQADFGGFVQDDWKLRPNFAFSFGLRYQGQTNAHGSLNLAPRIAFAWTPGNRQRTVIRGGGGLFYDWIPAVLNLTLDHFNGINQRQFIVRDPQSLDMFPQMPSIDQLNLLPVTTFSRASNYRAPYNLRSSISVEHSMSSKITFSASYLYAHGLRRFLIRNINAPLPGSGVRPFGNENNIYEWQTGGMYKHNLLIVNASIRPASKITLSANYALGYTNSNTDGAFLADSYDLRADYGRASTDIRHRFILNCSYNAPWGITFIPSVQAQSGPPFDIQTGIDRNNDTIYRDRPAIATDLTKPSVILTRFGAFDLAPDPTQRTISRNFGQSPGYTSVNFRISKSIVFSESNGAASRSQNGQPAPRPYRLTFGLDVMNALNHTNPGGIIGNLTASEFGTPFLVRQIGRASPSSNRNINLSMSFNF